MHDMRHVLCILNDLVTADGVLEAGDQLARRLRIDVRVLRPRPESDPSFMPTEEVMTLERPLIGRKTRRPRVSPG